MKFHDFQDHYRRMKARGGLPKGFTPQQFYEIAVEEMGKTNDPFSYRNAMIESDWVQDGRPYYNAWPAVFPMIRRLKLDIPCKHIEMPSEALLVRLPVKDNPLKEGEIEIKSILFGVQDVAPEAGNEDLIPGMVLLIDTGEEHESNLGPVYTFKIFPLRSDMTVDEVANSLPHHDSWNHGYQVSEKIVDECIKLCICICLVGKDPELVTPDILTKDEPKASRGVSLEELQERAKKRGKFGFHFGRGIESIPHYRRPHLAIVWTGKGRTVPKVVMRKGAVVKRSRITDVPTGRFDNE